MNVEEVFEDYVAFEDHMKQLYESGTITYAVFQIEKGKKTGRIHIQGYLELAKRNRLTALRKKIPFQIHWDKRRGTAIQASNYCKKGPEEEGGRYSGETIELGTLSTEEDGPSLKGQMIKAIKAGMPKDQVMEEFTPTWMQNHNAVDKYYDRRRVHDERKGVRCALFWGPAGAGKSYKCKELAKQAEAKGLQGVYQKTHHPGGWWPNYKGEQIVIMEDFDYKDPDIPFRTLLKLMEEGTMDVPIKGGFTQFRGKLLLFNANADVADWYPKQADKDALRRRFESVVFMDTRPEFKENGEFKLPKSSFDL